MQWGDGLRAQPSELSAQAADLRSTSRTLGEVSDGLRSLDVGQWQGRAAEAEHKRRERQCEAIDRQIKQLDPIAEALETAASSLSDIQDAQRRTVDKAHRWQFEIGDWGWITDVAGFNIDPRRPFVRAGLAASVVSLTFRLNTTDGKLAAKLLWQDGLGDLRELGAGIRDGVEDAIDWTGDRIEDGLSWASDQWDEHVQPRIDAAGAAWDRLKDGIDNPPQWFTDWVEDGKPPYISQVGGEAITVAARGIGIIANAITGEDQHIADDGLPWTGDTRVAGKGEIAGINDLMDITMDAYNRGDADRNSVTVTAVVGADGQVRYIASIPGTAEKMFTKAGWGGAPSGLDWSANFAHIGEGPTAATQGAADAVQQAIQQDIEYRRQRGLPVPEGKPELLLTGHSQGGIIAGQMITSSHYLDGYDVKGIVSAGSPTETLNMDRSVPVTNFQTQYDPIPRADLDGRRVNGSVDPTSNVTNITMPHSGQNGPGDYLPTYTHQQTTYQQDIATLSSGQGSPENVAAVRQLDEQYRHFLHGDTTTYKTQFGREYR
ncbi:putative T7SS-secreted protein [Tessaracoccus timonensis]|uniref:putative T7SS-secreted protein n=1 Tax=Tessaracoccus timonensis TaxID=2161816 RepID=UPI000D559675|nr:hypothetical protein [Tessaracoccus timonensis]